MISHARIVALALVVAACGGGNQKPASPNAPEHSPPGDIPDNQAFVRYAPPGAGYSVKVPEGWSRTSAGGAVSFTDKLNTIRLERRAVSGTPTVARARASEVPRLHAQPGYRAGTVTAVRRAGQGGVRITYLAKGPADPVTGKSRLDAVERYLFAKGGREAVLTLSGPKGADNVDPWRIVTESLRWTR